MPATEQTWRDQKRLHVVFGVSSTVLLLSTLWMFKADHEREWKQYQRTARDIDVRMTEWRQLEFQTEEIQQQLGELQTALSRVQAEEIDPQLLDRFASRAEQDEELKGFTGDLKAASGRADTLAAMDAILANASFREERLLNDRKFRRADLDKAKADYGLGIRDGRGPDVLQALRAVVEQVQADVDQINASYESVSQLRIDLDEIRKQATAAEDEAAKALADANTQLAQLETAVRERHSAWVEGYWLGKRWLELPILDAFNSPLKIDNKWADDLEWNINFRNVRRFDRCTTCHQMMEKTLPGSAVDPAYMNERLVTVTLHPAVIAAEAAAADSNVAQRLFDRMGLMLAGEGLVNRDDVTISYVQSSSPAATAEVVSAENAVRYDASDVMLSLLQPESSASPVRPDDEAREAREGLEAGDVIVTINGDPVFDGSERVAARLLALSDAGRTLELTVRRGMPNPFSTHPRLDLFVGSLSPHAAGEFACTICHEGQGSATAFKWASHTPDDPEQRARWIREYGWFDNHHWIYPMTSSRFTEANCLKCHHDVTELAASERFPEPPAPRVVEGYNLVRKFGCFGCHEINGFDGPDKRIGPDMRLEPNYFAVAQQLQAEPGFASLSLAEKRSVMALVHNPELDDVRHQLEQLLSDDKAAAAEGEDARFGPDVHNRLLPLLADIDSPGSMRRAGPSLRYVGSKIEAPFLSDWIRQPSHFRPSTRMPQFFGHAGHLPAHGVGDESEQFEPLEVLAMSHYLLANSQSFEYLAPFEGVTEEGDIDRGRVQFQERGCLACHSHREFKDIEAFRDPEEIVQGPDLSDLAAKFSSEAGKKWLYSWIRQPSRYHARTVMPDLFLEPIETRDMEGNVTAVSDPAADIVAYLLSDDQSGWAPAEGTLSDGSRLTRDQVGELDSLASEHLQGSYYVEQAKQFLKWGIASDRSASLQGADLELVVPAESHGSQELSLSQKLMFVGRRSITKYGCYGCHDIPGYEDAKPIGTGLADWGRKEPSKLAYEHILEYLGIGHHGSHGATHDDTHVEHAETESPARDVRGSEFDDDLPEFFSQQLQSHNRIGFLYQKLREPRGYDFEKTEEKGYNERLLMPQFPFSTEQREAVMTFVLGLVAEPPRPKYVYQPDAKQQALLEGRRVLEKYNCAGCHLLTPEKWDVAFGESELDEANDQAAFLPSASAASFPFVTEEYTQAEHEAAAGRDHRNQMHATLVGMPALGDDAYPLIYSAAVDDNLLVDDEDVALEDLTRVPFQLWQPALVGTTVYQSGTLLPGIPPELITRRQAPDGGVLARYLLTHVTAREKQINPNAKGTESWAWVPPPLVQEGVKVQTGWLHDFLLDPYPIRPAVVLRMPRFNMSSEEATALVNYFAARDDAQYPYAYNAERDAELLEIREAEYSSVLAGLPGPAAELSAAAEGLRLRDAMQIVTSSNYCVKCHVVGDFSPAGADRGKAPDLSRVYQRLRPDYVRRWIAKPTGVLPFTSMPVNVPYKPEDEAYLGGVAQDLYHGTSINQIDALVDLLMNYDAYAKRRTTIRPLVEAAAAAAQTSQNTDPGESSSDSSSDEPESSDTTTSGGP